MKKLIFGALILAVATCLAVSCGSSKTAVEKPLVVAYVWSGDDKLPDPEMVTTINYAFAYPDSTLTGVRVDNPRRLLQTIALKKQNPELKVTLSFGGNCYNGYPQLAASDSLRKAFAASCRSLVDSIGLDGIDFDWEFPGTEGGTPDDPANFVLLIKELRNALGPDRLLTIAGGATACGLIIPDLVPYVDYIMTMSYDMGWQAPYHHTALRRSPLAGVFTLEESLDSFLLRGLPPEKLVVGLAFYGRGNDKDFKGWVDYKDIAPREGMTELWDSVACVPYIVDSLGTLVVGYENPRSLEIKCDYIKEHKYRGAMYWRVETDTDSLELARTVARCMLGVDKPAPKPQYQVLTYVWSGGDFMPDTDMITGINYAFGRITDDRKAIRIENPDRLRQTVALKEKKPSLKVLLSIGGGCSEGFTDLAASDENRRAFAADCRRVVDEFGLDGIDFDWESPAFPDGTPEDVDNFELLLAETRKALGDDRLITVASMAGALGMKLPQLLDYVDYFNVMAYDMTWTKLGSHTSMRQSEIGGFDYNVERALQTYKEKGVPADRIMLGLAFYGRGDGKNFEEWTQYRDIKLRPGMEVRWDSVGCVPYVVDSLGNFILGYDDQRSLEIKCQLIKDRGLRGGMCWRTEHDTDSLELARVVARCLLGK